jgi:kynurenine 3-monooxygenase
MHCRNAWSRQVTKTLGAITIAGAGLVGSLLSVLLGKRGYEVSIFERRSDMRGKQVDAGRSINLALSRRGIHALDQAGLMPDVEKLLIPMRGRVLHLENGRTEFLPYGQRPDEVIYSVSRRDLNCLMMTAAEIAPPVNIYFDRELSIVDFDRGLLMFTDDKESEEISIPFQRLIGADGAGSKVRRALMERVGGNSRSEFLDHDYKELEIPAGPLGGFQIEKEALHIWPRGTYMLIALPNLDGSFTVTLFMPKTGEPSFESLEDPQKLVAFFEEKFPDALRLIPDLEEDYYSHPQGPLGTVYCSPWHYRTKC